MRENRVALVTGGVTGLGKEISLDLARQGMDIAINYSRSEKDAIDTAREIQEIGRECLIVQADVSSSSQVGEMMQQVIDRYGRLDVLVANAGTTVFRSFEDLDGVTESDWDRIMNVNVKGVWLTAKAAAPYLKASGKGRIVITSSIAGIRPSGSSLPYSVSKAAVIHLTKGLAKALAPDVLVNTIAPGLLETRWSAGHSQAFVENYMAAAPLKRTPTLDDCVKQVRGLVETETITGTTVVIDSGMSM